MQRKYAVAGGAFLGAFFLDQLSKTLIQEVLAPAGRVTVIDGIFDLRYAQNVGMAFGMLQDLDPSYRIPLFTVIALVAVAIIFHLLKQAPALSIRLSTGLGLIMAGAFGNLADRFRWGYVVDFLRFKVWPPSNMYWPTFNLADTFISIGIGLLILDTFLARDYEDKPETPELEETVDSTPSVLAEEDLGE